MKPEAPWKSAGFWSELATSTPFQIVIVPSALSLIGLLFAADEIKYPAVFVTAGVALAMLLIIGFRLNQTMSEIRIVPASGIDATLIGVHGVVVAASAYPVDRVTGGLVKSRLGPPPASPDAFEARLSAWQTDAVGRIVTEASVGYVAIVDTRSSRSMKDDLAAWCSRVGVQVEVFEVPEADVGGIKSGFISAINWLQSVTDDRVVVDATYGQVPTSIGGALAAAEMGIEVLYQHSAGSVDQESEVRFKSLLVRENQ